MEQKEKDALDWWTKPEHLEKQDAKQSRASKSRSKSKSGAKKATTISRGRFVWLIIKNCVIIAILALVMAVLAHFVLRWTTRHGAGRSVPQFKMLDMSEAKRLAERYELQLVINDSLYAPAYAGGVILDQLPESGTVVKPHRTVYLTINAMEQKMVDVPYVAGRSLRQAKNMLEVAGLQIERLIYQPDMATNYILAQSLGEEEVTAESELRAAVGSGVTLYVGVGEGRDETLVPHLIGKSLFAARSALWEAGLNVGALRFDEGVEVSDEAVAVVYGQGIEAEEPVSLGRDVTLRLSPTSHKADSVLSAMRDVERFQEEMRLLEEQISDSLMLYVVDTAEVKPAKKRVERVDFEDLFN